MDLQFLQDRQEANVFSNYFAVPSVHIDLGLPAILAQENHHPRRNQIEIRIIRQKSKSNGISCKNKKHLHFLTNFQHPAY